MPKDYGGKLDREARFDAFDPNAEDDNEWASFIPRWRGSFHTHATRGGALRALNPRFIKLGVLYRRQGRRWVEVARIDRRIPDADNWRFARPTKCDGCGKDRNAALGDFFTPVWLRHGSRVADPPQVVNLCTPCLKRNR